MEEFVLSNENYRETSLNIELKELDFLKIINKYHFDSKHRERLNEVYKALKKVIKPIANITIVEKEAKERLSFVTESRYIIGMITLGIEVDQLLMEYHKANKVFEAYALDCLGMELLSICYEQFETFTYQICGQWPEKYEFIGDNYPLESIQEILNFVPQTKITRNQAYILIPSKSVVFLSTLSNQKKECALHMCDNCSNKNCKMQRKARNYGEIQIFGGGK